jgi:TonB family protein
MRKILALAVLYVVLPRAAEAQIFNPIFNGTDLNGWKIEHTNARVADRVLRVGSGNGWVRTERVYADFVMTLDVRLEARAEAGVYVRGWPTFNRSSSPNNAYRLAFSPLTSNASDWSHVQVECIGPRVTVRVDGAVVHTADALENPQGHVALWATEGTAQFRSIEIKRLPPPRPQTAGGVAMVGAGVSAPTAVTRGTPRYTAEAMRARITGTVMLSGTVMPDGTIADIAVIQSLDPKLGLDATAIETAQSWRFQPGLRAGEPVPVRITLEFDFNLK